VADALAVVNASPLIILSRGCHLDLLRSVAAEMLVPDPVRGTLGIVLRAKSLGLVPSARRVMEDLLRIRDRIRPRVGTAAASAVWRRTPAKR